MVIGFGFVGLIGVTIPTIAITVSLLIIPTVPSTPKKFADLPL